MTFWGGGWGTVQPLCMFVLNLAFSGGRYCMFINVDEGAGASAPGVTTDKTYTDL